MLARTPRDPTNAERSRRARERQRKGQVVVSVVVDESDMIKMLLEANLLRPDQVDDPRAWETAMAVFIDTIFRRDT